MKLVISSLLGPELLGAELGAAALRVLLVVGDFVPVAGAVCAPASVSKTKGMNAFRIIVFKSVLKNGNPVRLQLQVA